MIVPYSDVQVHIECPWHTRAVHVWFYWRAGDGIQVWNVVADEIITISDGMPLPDKPSLVLPDASFLKAFGEKATEIAPPNTQMAAHLKDTCTVRDRLLTIVERVTK